MDQSFNWIVYSCMVPTLQQGALISGPLLMSGILVRLCVFLNFADDIIHALVAMMGMYVLWFFYSNGIIYFLSLCGAVYIVLLAVHRHKGIIIAMISLAFLLIR